MSVSGIGSNGAKMIDIDQDLNLFYLGGSGGFIFLHWMLLLKKHFCQIPIDNNSAAPFRQKFKDIKPLDRQNYESIQDHLWPSYKDYKENFPKLLDSILRETSRQYSLHGDDQHNDIEWYDANLSAIFTKQWNLSSTWKATEQWPENDQTLLKSCNHKKFKIYFTCNDVQKWVSFPGQKIILYTDIRTQLRLSYYKKAWIFYNSNANKSFRPIVKNILQNKSTLFNGVLISSLLKPLISPVTQLVCLQDLLLKPSEVFGITHNDEQCKLLKIWANLHPPELLNKIGLSPLLY
jgi:hypothetical protein